MAAPRRRRDEVRGEVRDAVLGLLEDASYKDLSVDQIAKAAGLTRSAFYFYFEDKRDLLLAAATEVTEELYAEADRWWHGEGEPEELIRSSLTGMTEVYVRHAPLLRAATEVSTYDQEVSAVWRELVGRFITATTDYMRREGLGGPQPERTAEALVWMSERCLYVFLATGDRSAQDLVETLAQVWLAALYPDRALSAAA